MSEIDLNNAINMIKAGNKDLALETLSKVIKREPNNEAAWLWLSVCSKTTDQRIFCLRKVLDINPANEKAIAALTQLKPIPEPSQAELTGIQDSQNSDKPENPDRLPQLLGWYCPECIKPINTEVILRTKIVLRCEKCDNSFSCINGELLWGQYFVDDNGWSVRVLWTVRIKQLDVNFREATFEVITPEFTLTTGDYIVLLYKKNKVICVDNKSSGKIFKLSTNQIITPNS